MRFYKKKTACYNKKKWYKSKWHYTDKWHNLSVCVKSAAALIRGSLCNCNRSQARASSCLCFIITSEQNHIYYKCYIYFNFCYFIHFLYKIFNSIWIKNPYRRTSEHNHIYIYIYIYIKRDSAHNFSFSYIKLGFVEFQNKR